MHLFHKIDGMDNTVHNDQTGPSAAVWSRYALFEYAILLSVKLCTIYLKYLDRYDKPTLFTQIKQHFKEQQHLLQQLQALGAQEMQWAQALDKGPW